VSAPWWHPEANPLRDIRELKAALEFEGTGVLRLPEREGDLADEES
jgi:hypothetical protein